MLDINGLFSQQRFTMLFINISDMQSISAIQLQMKGSVTKIPVPCPVVIEMYSQDMDGIGLVDQRIAHLDRKSSIRI